MLCCGDGLELQFTDDAKYCINSIALLHPDNPVFSRTFTFQQTLIDTHQTAVEILAGMQFTHSRGDGDMNVLTASDNGNMAG